MNDQKISPNGYGPGWVDGEVFNENRNRVPWEQIEPFRGQYVAWNLDGTKILAGAATEEDLDQKLATMGIHFSNVVHSYVADI